MSIKTEIEWFAVEELLPITDCRYSLHDSDVCLVIRKGGTVDHLHYNSQSPAGWTDDIGNLYEDVTHWASWPQAPLALQVELVSPPWPDGHSHLADF